MLNVAGAQVCYRLRCQWQRSWNVSHVETKPIAAIEFNFGRFIEALVSSTRLLAGLLRIGFLLYRSLILHIAMSVNNRVAAVFYSWVAFAPPSWPSHARFSLLRWQFSRTSFARRRIAYHVWIRCRCTGFHGTSIVKKLLWSFRSRGF